MRQTVLNLEESKIREVANAGMGRADVLPFWFGESDEATPDAVRDAAIASLQSGETFYSHNLGLPALRDAVAAYSTGLHGPYGHAVSADRIAITSGGVNALIVAMQALVDAGDEVVAVTPVWPNLTAQPLIMGARLRCVPLQPDAQGAWQLDLPALLAAITPATRLLIINSPNNPTGWTLTHQEQAAILAHCRATGTWILADEVYERLYYRDDTPTRAAPSFLDVAQPQDRLVVAQSFSKAFLMTGWRLGYLILPPEMTLHVGKLIEFNTSCAPVFAQRGGTGSPGAGRNHHAAHRRPPARLPRHARALAASRAGCGNQRGARWHVRLLSRGGLCRFAATGQTPGGRGRLGPGARRRVRARGRRLVALVLCVQGHGAP